jgi:transcription initiation factor TFIID subunit 6
MNGSGPGVLSAAAQGAQGIRSSTVHVIAATVGIARLREDVAAYLATDAEYRLREIIQEAGKFMRHSKRRRLKTSDIAAALRLRNLEPLYGFSSNESAPFVGVTLPGESSLGGSNTVYFVGDEEVDLRDILDGELPRVPLETTLALHWLAIEGIQPRIPQNPADVSSTARQSLTYILRDTVHDEPGRNASDTPDTDTGMVSFRPKVRHVVSRELQLYYELAIEALTRSAQETDETLRNACLASIARDPGLQQLVPYFVAFLFHHVSNHCRDLPQLQVSMKLARALLENRYVGLEPYLHQLMPSIITCIVGRYLCRTADEDHWTLRENAASLLADVHKMYGGTYENLLPRIAETLRLALVGEDKALTTQYGAIVAFQELGPALVEAHIVPLAPNLLERWERKIEHELGEAPLKSAELELATSPKWSELRRVYAALAKALGVGAETLEAKYGSKYAHFVIPS